MRLRHRFQAGGTLLRELTAGLQMTGNGAESFSYGGQVSATGRIRKSEYDANPAAYVPGTLWLILDDDDGGKCIWGGRLDNEPEEDGFFYNLHANGPGKDPDERTENRFWQSRDETEWTAGDSEPHSYDQDRQIFAKVSGRRLVFGWERKTLFIRNRGETRLNGAHSKNASTISVNLNAGGLAIGEVLRVGEDRYAVRNTYSAGSTSIPVSPDLVRDYPASTKVYWSANDGPGEWASGLCLWKEGKDFNRTKIHVEFDRHVPATLQLLRANGPNGSLTLVNTVDLSSGALSRDEDAPSIAGNMDLLYLRLRRTVESDDTGADKGFRLVVTDTIVNGLAGNSDDYTADNVARDIYGDYPGMLQVANSSVNAMPLDGTDRTDGELLDHLCRLTPNRYWSRRREDDGSGFKNIFDTIGDTEFILRQKGKARAPVRKKQLPRFNVVAVPYRGPGGTKLWVDVRADPDPFPAEEFVFRFDLDDPLPPLAEAEILGRNAVDILSGVRYRWECECTELVNEAGNVVPASRLREGDVVILENLGNKRVPVHYLAQAPGGRPIVQFSNVLREPGPTGHPLLDRLLERRVLVFARGRSNAHATIGGFDIDRPAVPENVRVIKKEVAAEGGRRRYSAIGIFDPVVRDVDGTGTSIRGYVGQFRFRDKDTNELLRDDEGEVIVEERRKRRKRNDDTSDDGNPLRIACRIPKPRKHIPEFRAASIDYAGEQSKFSSWATTTAATFGPDAIPAISVVVSSTGVTATWDNDDTETNDKGDLLRNQKAAHVIAKLYKNGVKHLKTQKVYDEDVHWDVPNIGNHTWRVDVYPVDHHGGTGPITSNASSRGRPAAPLNSPTLSFTRGGRRGLRAKGTVAGYTGGDGRDIVAFILQLQAEPSNPVTGDEKTRLVIDIEPDEASTTVSGLWEEFVKPGHKCRARYAVRDAGGKVSTFGPYGSPPVTASAAAKTPGPVRNKRREGGPRFVEWAWDPPNQWSDGTSSGFSLTEVPGYRGDVRHNGIVDNDKSFTFANKLSHRIKVPEGSSGWSLEVIPQTWEDVEGTPDGDTVTIDEVGYDIGPGDLNDGAINSPRQFATGVGPIEIFGTLPATGNVDGRTVFLTSDRKMYRYFAATTSIGGVFHGPGWVKAADGGDTVVGTITADKLNVSTLSAITANLGTATAGTLTAVNFHSSSGGSNIYMGPGAPGAIQWRSSFGGGHYANIAGNGSNGLIVGPNAGTLELIGGLTTADVLAPRGSVLELRTVLLSTSAPQWSTGLSGTTNLGTLPGTAIGWVRVMRGDGTTGRVPMYT